MHALNRIVTTACPTCFSEYYYKLLWLEPPAISMNT